MRLTYSRELEFAGQLARRAGAAAMNFYDSATADPGTSASPVTAADRAANDVIVRALRAEYPGDAILSEESADSVDRLGVQRVWIVDPVDGTKEFLARNGEFAVMIGLAVGGRPLVGAVYLPALDVLYFAARGGGAFMERGGTRTLLKRSNDHRSEGIRLVGSRSHAEPMVEQLSATLGISDVAPCGSVGVKCARIVEGARDLYVHPVPYMKEWDTCAPEVVAREAGCHVSDCIGEALQYNKPDPRQPHGILVCAPEFTSRVLPAVAALYGNVA